MYDFSLDYFIVWSPAVAAITEGATIAGDQGLVTELYQYPDGSLQFARDQLPRMDAAWAGAGRLGHSFEQNTRWRSLASWEKKGFGLLIPESHFMRLGGECGIIVYPVYAAPVDEHEYRLEAVHMRVNFRRSRRKLSQSANEMVNLAVQTVNDAFRDQQREIRIVSSITEHRRALSFQLDLTDADQFVLNALILYALGWGDDTAPVSEVRLAER